MSHHHPHVRAEDIAELARLIRRNLRSTGEVVLATDDLGEFLGNGSRLDSVRVQEIIREAAEAHGWDSFVFDYGALVRFSQRNRGEHRVRRLPGRRRTL
jgi:hypothetical protein